MERAVQVISAEEWELTSFFEAVPEFPHEGEPWPYTTVRFKSDFGDFRVECELLPAYRDIDLRLFHSESVIYSLRALGVNDVQYANQSGSESLLIWLSTTETVRIWLRPQPKIVHESSRE